MEACGHPSAYQISVRNHRMHDTFSLMHVTVIQTLALVATDRRRADVIRTAAVPA